MNKLNDQNIENMNKLNDHSIINKGQKSKEGTTVGISIG
jgi:hypothetical protein